MSSEPAREPPPGPAAARGASGVPLRHIFAVFLTIGATSVGGALVAYMRRALVDRQKWVDDQDFVRMLTICQALPGLNGTNMAILMGDHLRGPFGAVAAIFGVILPGGAIMVGAAALYAEHGNQAVASAMLTTIAAGAVGVAFSVAVQLGRKSLKNIADFVFVGLTVIGVNLLHYSVLLVLIGVGVLAIYWYRPRRGRVGP